MSMLAQALAVARRDFLAIVATPTFLLFLLAPLMMALTISLNPDEHIVTANGARVELTYKEYELLRLFLQHPGMAFTRDQLMEKVWGTDYYGETRTIDMHIRTLRQKLGACGEQIGTVRGVGYRLEASK